MEDFRFLPRYFQFPRGCGLSGGDRLSAACGWLARNIGAIGRVTAVGTHDLCVRCVKAGRVTTCTDARECLAGGRPLCQRLQRQGFNGYGRSTERPYKGYTSHFDTTDATDAQIVRPYKGYTSRSCVPTRVTRLDRASLQPLHVSQYYNGRSTVRSHDGVARLIVTHLARLLYF